MKSCKHLCLCLCLCYMNERHNGSSNIRNIKENMTRYSQTRLRVRTLDDPCHVVSSANDLCHPDRRENVFSPQSRCILMHWLQVNTMQSQSSKKVENVQNYPSEFFWSWKHLIASENFPIHLKTCIKKHLKTSWKRIRWPKCFEFKINTNTF